MGDMGLFFEANQEAYITPVSFDKMFALEIWVRYESRPASF